PPQKHSRPVSRPCIPDTGFRTKSQHASEPLHGGGCPFKAGPSPSLICRRCAIPLSSSTPSASPALRHVLSRKTCRPSIYAGRAKSNGWVSGQHMERDKEGGLNNYEPKVLAKQDALPEKFAIWSWDKTYRSRPFDCKAWSLRKDAPVPELHD
ncbi:Uncharacterized protein TCAP_04993, partial [Tolypocladium capitatum]